MSDSEKQKLSQRERQIARIDQLEAMLQKEKSKLRSQARKERNSQLIALGLYMEIYLRNNPEKNCSGFKEVVKDYLFGRNLKNALAAADRILEEERQASPKKEISPEPPSQPPAAKATEKSQGSA